MANKYRVKLSDPGNMLIEGKVVTPYYEDDKETIVPSAKTDHHIKKDGEYFAKHLEPIGGAK